MAVGFCVDSMYYEAGHGSFLYSFFSTVCYRLEKGAWGSRFPYLMNNLYRTGLEWTDIPFARKELEAVQEELSGFPPADVIWDIDDLSKSPPWGNNISGDITDLSNYFVTSDGEDLITVMFTAFDDAEESRQKIEIVNM